MDIGNKIKEFRNIKGLTQEQLAAECSLSKNAIWNYENNKRKPTIETIDKISKALGITINELLGIQKSFSKSLIDALEFPILQMCGIVDTLEVLSNELKIEYEELEKVLTNELELSLENQFKILKYFYKIDFSQFLSFCEENDKYIKNNKKLNDLYIKAITNKLLELETTSYFIFKKYLLTTFGDKINEFVSEDDIIELQEETDKFLEYALYKIEKKYYGEDVDDEDE